MFQTGSVALKLKLPKYPLFLGFVGHRGFAIVLGDKFRSILVYVFFLGGGVFFVFFFFFSLSLSLSSPVLLRVEGRTSDGWGVKTLPCPRVACSMLVLTRQHCRHTPLGSPSIPLPPSSRCAPSIAKETLQECPSTVSCTVTSRRSKCLAFEGSLKARKKQRKQLQPSGSSETKSVKIGKHRRMSGFIFFLIFFFRFRALGICLFCRCADPAEKDRERERASERERERESLSVVRVPFHCSLR